LENARVTGGFLTRKDRSSLSGLDGRIPAGAMKKLTTPQLAADMKKAAHIWTAPRPSRLPLFSVLDGVFGVVEGRMRSALGFVHLAFGLQPLAAGHFSGRVLDAPLALSAAPLTCSLSMKSSFDGRENGLRKGRFRRNQTLFKS
jgi:hypothetical protein